jgi:hypothetical protein
VTGTVARFLPLAVGLVLVGLMTVTAPDLDTAPRQWVPLSVTERGELRDFRFAVTSVQVTSSLELREDVVTSSGVFVVVETVADVLVDPVSFGRVELQTRAGDRYDPRDEWITARPPMADPGFTSRGSWVFEVPRGAARGARLLVQNDAREFDGFDRALRVDLALDSGNPRPGALRLSEGSLAVTR